MKSYQRQHRLFNIYSIVSSFAIEKYISGTTPDDYHIDFDEFSIVKKNNKYGIVNTNFGYSFGNHIKSAIIHEIIPCIYDAIYSEHGAKYTDKDLTELTKAELGFPNGRFKIDESYFVSSQDELLHCNRYNISGKLLYAFSCEAFNRHYIVKSNNYYFINHRYGPEEEAYDYISEISCLSGRIDVDPIYPDSWNHYSSQPTPKGYLKYMRANLLPIAHKEDTWHVFSDFGKKDLLFSCKCSRIVEYGRYEEGCYYAIVESNNSKLIYIIKDSKIIFQSFPMQNISSSYKLINERSSYDKYHDGKYISNYFIAMQHNGKEIVIKWNCFEESAICSEEYDEINLINDESVRVCIYAEGTNLYNKMIIYCDGFALLSEKWCKSQLATLFL